MSVRTVFLDAPECISTWESVRHDPKALVAMASRGLEAMWQFSGPVPIPVKTVSRFWVNGWHFYRPDSRVSMREVEGWAKTPSRKHPGLALAGEAYHLKRSWVQVSRPRQKWRH